MSKRAEERALEAYPHLEQPVFDEMYPRLLFTRNTERSAFVRGYEQAVKDLALTVEDIKTILDISFWNDDPEKILEEYNRICDTSKVTRR